MMVAVRAYDGYDDDVIAISAGAGGTAVVVVVPQEETNFAIACLRASPMQMKV